MVLPSESNRIHLLYPYPSQDILGGADPPSPAKGGPIPQRMTAAELIRLADRVPFVLGPVRGPYQQVTQAQLASFWFGKGTQELPVPMPGPVPLQGQGSGTGGAAAPGGSGGSGGSG